MQAPKPHTLEQPVKALFILNDPPYGTERTYNGLRLATALLKVDSAVEVVVFLLGDAAAGARRGQKTPEGYYNIERMLHRLLSAKARVLVCGTCMDARGLQQEELTDGAARSTMDELADTAARADKVFVF